MICYYYFPPCGNVTHFIEPQSVCASTCTNITEVLCYEEWNTVVDEVNEHGLDVLAERFNAHFIDCADPESPFDEAPFCCSNTGLDIDACKYKSDHGSITVVVADEMHLYLFGIKYKILCCTPIRLPYVHIYYMHA